jgi:gamma-glutamylcyclotransferase (GGCT)/AIG2-like uncharacterized protein YtfP
MEFDPVTVFVYGTLMRGQRNHHYISNNGGRFVAHAVTCNEYLFRRGPTPRLFRTSNILRRGTVQQVFGEAYTIPWWGLPLLDHQAGHPFFYSRKSISVQLLPSMERKLAYTYFFLWL